MDSNNSHEYYGRSSAELDPHCQKNGVLINTLGLTTTEELNKAEGELTSPRITSLVISPMRGVYDLDHAKQVHRYIFQDIYPWAGEVRRVDISKNDTRFLENELIGNAFVEIGQHLKDSGLFGGEFKSSKEFSKEAGTFFGALNHVHPFREGNGRTQRELLRLLAYDHGYSINWSGTSPMAMKNACIDFQHDPTGKSLAKLIYLACSSVPKEMDILSQFDLMKENKLEKSKFKDHVDSSVRPKNDGGKEP